MPDTSKLMTVINSILQDIPGMPLANAGNLPEVGATLQLTGHANDFLNVLVDKVGMTIVRTKLFENPLKVLKKGSMPLGYVIEELGANPAEVKNYSNSATTAMLNQVKPDIKAVYHELNSKKFTKVTVCDDDLTTAFKDYNAFESFLGMITNTLYAGAEKYDFEACKNTIITAKTRGDVVVKQLPAPAATQEEADAFILALKDYSSAFKFPSTAFNKYAAMTGAVGQAYETWTPVEDQILIMRSDILNKLDIYAMAKAFNISYEKLVGNIIEVDYIDPAKDINAVLMDKSAFVYYDKLDKTSSFFNGESLAWTYWYHFWKVYDISPLANMVVFTESAVQAKEGAGTNENPGA